MSDGNTDIISSIIAGASVIISMIALRFSSQASKGAKQAQDISNELQKQNNSLQERMICLEETRQEDSVIEANKAELIAKLNCTVTEYNTGKFPLRNKTFKLEIENIGRSTAKKVRAFINGISIQEIVDINTDDGEHDIGSNSKVSYSVSIKHDFSPPFRFSLTWDDDSGVQGNYKTTLT